MNYSRKNIFVRSIIWLNIPVSKFVIRLFAMVKDRRSVSVPLKISEGNDVSELFVRTRCLMLRANAFFSNTTIRFESIFTKPFELMFLVSSRLQHAFMGKLQFFSNFLVVVSFRLIVVSACVVATATFVVVLAVIFAVPEIAVPEIAVF